MSTPTRPVLRYHGGKWRLAPWIISHFPPHRVYVELFGGAASVLMRKPRSDVEFYNDLDDQMVNLFRVLRDHGAELERRLRLTPFARSEFEWSYEPTEDPIERARRTVVRAQMGFGTLALVQTHTGFRRTSHRNKKTGSASDWAEYHSAIAAIVERLQGVCIENADALDLIHTLDDPHVLFYVDPPYVHSTRGKVSGSHGYAYEMTDDQHRDLAAALHRVEGMVVLSGYHSDLYDDLYGDWWRVERSARAHGNRGAVKRVEVLWLNAAAARHQQPNLFDEMVVV